MKISVVIPCYNEEENIPLLLERFGQVVGDRDIAVILVNNGSTDGSAAVIDALLPAYPFASALTVAENRGYGYGILQGLRAADGDYIGWTHADLQTDPADIVRALDVIARQPEPIYIKGRRQGRPLFDRVFTAGMGLFESLYFRQRLFDINAQPNLFPRSFFASWENPPYDFAIEVYSLYQARAQGLRVTRIPVDFSARAHGQSSWQAGLRSKWKYVRRTLAFSYHLKHPQKGK